MVQTKAKSNTVESAGNVQTTEKESEAEPKEPVTITYYFNNAVGEQQYTSQVEDKLNEILSGMEGYEHISIDLVPGANYAQEFTLAQASDAQIDLVSTYGLDMSTMVKNGDFLPLEDLLQKYPDVTSELPDWLVGMGQLFGTQYYIPTYQQAASITFLYMPTEYMEITGTTKEQMEPIFQTPHNVAERCEFLEDYLLKVREATGKDTKWLHHNIEYGKYESVGNLYGNFSIFEGDKYPVYRPLEEEYKVLMGYYAKWYQEGLIHSDIATIKSSDFVNANFLNDESYVCNAGSNCCSEEDYEKIMGTTVPVAAIRQDNGHAYIPSTYAAGGNAIYADCEHPEEAMMIMELLNTKKGEEFYNTLCWGLEGIHYEWVDKENKRIKTLEFEGSQGTSTCTYTAWKWNLGNTFNAWKNQAVTDGYNDYILDNVHNAADTVVSPYIGITWDFSTISDQVAQIQAVEKEYTKQSIYTADDWETKYDEYVKKLEAAGVYEVLDCLKKQVDEFLATK